MQITDLVRDSPLRDLGTVLSQCIHVVVPRDEQDSFEYDPKEEVDTEKEKDGDSDESDEDYVPEGGSKLDFLYFFETGLRMLFEVVKFDRIF